LAKNIRLDAKPAFVFDGRNILDRSKMESIDLCISDWSPIIRVTGQSFKGQRYYRDSGKVIQAYCQG
jgi:hypothetical protein